MAQKTKTPITCTNCGWEWMTVKHYEAFCHKCGVKNAVPRQNDVPNQYTDSTGRLVILLPVGTRIKHVKWPKLVGTINRYEYCKSSIVSALPYHVTWDDDYMAFRCLGVFRMWPNPDNIGVAQYVHVNWRGE